MQNLGIQDSTEISNSFQKAISLKKQRKWWLS